MARPRLTRTQAVRLLGTGASVPVPSPRPLVAPRTTQQPKAGQNACATATRVLGVDLALRTTGWALLVDGWPAAHGSFVLPEQGRQQGQVAWLHACADELVRHLALLVRAWTPELIAYEFPDTPHRWSGSGKLQDFRAVRALGRVEGMLTARWPDDGGGTPLLPVPMSEAKRVATGRPSASKDQVRWALMTYRGWDLVGWSDDESDAASIGLAALEGMHGNPKRP